MILEGSKKGIQFRIAEKKRRKSLFSTHALIKVQVEAITDTMERKKNTINVLITLQAKIKRTRYLWANAIIEDENDPRCPLIEG